MKKQIVALIISLFLLFNLSPVLVFGQATDSDISITVESLDPDESSDGTETTENTENIDEDYPVETLPAPSLNADGAIVVDQNTGKVLFEKNMHKKLYPASTTKVLTALLAIELGNLNDMITVGEEINMIEWDSSKAGLVIGEKISLENLIYGLLINSGNDAANTIAVYIARTESGKNLDLQESLDYFANLMTTRAKQAGALNSHFANAHGYHDPNHYTTAYDLSMIGRDAMNNEFFRKAISMTSFDTTNGLDGSPRFWRNKNRLLQENSQDYYEYAIGGKTGFTSEAGQCLITMSSKNDMNLVSVVFKCDSSQQWVDTRNILEYSFSNYRPYKFFEKGTIVETFPVDNYAPDDWGSLAVQIGSDDLIDILNVNDIPLLEENIIWDTELFTNNESNSQLPRLSAPITKDQKIGELVISLNGEVLARSNITAVRDVKKRTILDLPQIIKDEEINWLVPIMSIIVAFIALKIIVFIINKRRRRTRYTYRL